MKAIPAKNKVNSAEKQKKRAANLAETRAKPNFKRGFV
jgi:hypothetical protein